MWTRGVGAEVHYLLSGDQQDLVLGLLQALLGARDLDLVAEVVGSRDLDLGGGPELEFLELLPALPDDVAMVFLGDRHSGGCLPVRWWYIATC